jgi:hypothetical protein
MNLHTLVVGKSTKHYRFMYFLGKCNVMKKGGVKHQIMVLFLFLIVFSTFFESYPEE